MEVTSEDYGEFLKLSTEYHIFCDDEEVSLIQEDGSCLFRFNDDPRHTLRPFNNYLKCKWNVKRISNHV